MLSLAIALFVFWASLTGCEFNHAGATYPISNCVHVREIDDSLHTAAQLGRLDVISLALTVLSVSIAFATIGGYVTVRHAAIRSAREEAPNAINAVLPGLLSLDILAQALKDNPEILMRTMNRINRIKSGISDEEANRIAEYVGLEEKDET